MNHATARRLLAFTGWYSAWYWLAGVTTGLAGYTNPLADDLRGFAAALIAGISWRYLPGWLNGAEPDHPTHCPSVLDLGEWNTDHIHECNHPRSRGHADTNATHRCRCGTEWTELTASQETPNA